MSTMSEGCGAGVIKGAEACGAPWKESVDATTAGSWTESMLAAYPAARIISSCSSSFSGRR
jgi:hypothetical protein